MKTKKAKTIPYEVQAAASALGKLGGIARRKATTKTQRSANARKAANVRWGNSEKLGRKVKGG